MLTALASVAAWPWSKPPPPPPTPPQSASLLPTALAVLSCWVVPALLYHAGKQPKPVAGKEERAQQAVTKPVHHGVLIASLMCFLSVSAAAVTFPFIQTRRDALGCDAICQGGQTSLRSALSLVGAAVIGRASDQFGRIPMLWLGLAASLGSLAISGSMDSIEGMWYAIVPVALFNQNFSVAKALLSDYIDELGGTDADRAGAVGKLGMAVGFSFMAGPMLAATFVSDYRQALLVSAAVTTLSGALIAALPSPKRASSATSNGNGGGGGDGGGGIMSFVRLPVLQTRGAQLLMLVRLLMALAFHMFAPVWQVSIKARFNFGPQDHAQFMGLIGLTYALSQVTVGNGR